MLALLLLVIIVVCVAFLYMEGMWSNAVRFVNVVTAAVLATCFWEPLADWLEEFEPSYTYVWDFLSMWAVFCACMLLFRVLTDQISKVKVRFLKIADRIGSASFALLIGWVMMSFTLTTLHTAPLGKNFLFGGFQSGQAMFMGFSPDKAWLGFVRNVSCGAYCRSATEAEWEKKKYVFDPYGDFMKTYEDRRETVEEHNKAANTLRVNR